MGKTSTLSSKGQITIPLKVRKRLGLREGDRVEFVEENAKTILRPARAPKNPFEKYVGAVPSFSNLGEIHRWIGNLRDNKSRKK